MRTYRKHVLICASSECADLGGERVFDTLKGMLRQRGLARDFRLTKTGCLKECEHGPILVVYPEGIWYTRVGVDDLDEIVEQHLLGGQIVPRLLYFTLDNTGGKWPHA